MIATSQPAFKANGVKGIEVLARGGNRSSSLSNGNASSEPPTLDGIVDLKDSTDTSYHYHHAPAVTHETVNQTVHEIREEQITREIHHYDVIHRIQPVIDLEVLPTKHYVQQLDGTLDEIPASEVDESLQEISRFVERVAESNAHLEDSFNTPKVPANVGVKAPPASCALEATPPQQVHRKPVNRESADLSTHGHRQYDSVHDHETVQHAAHEATGANHHGYSMLDVETPGAHESRSADQHDWGKVSYEEPRSQKPKLAAPAVRTAPATPATPPQKEKGLRAKIRRVLKSLRGSKN